MDDHPLPNSDSDSCGSDQTSVYDEDDFSNCFVVRLTPCGRYNIEDVVKYLNEMSCASWILGVETKPQEHYHLVIEHEESLDDIKARLRSFIYLYWDESERKRGFGNKQYNCQLCKDKLKAISYAIKDKEYQYEGYTQEFIDSCLEKSFQKNSPTSFQVEFTELNKRFHDSNMPISGYMAAFMILKSKYNQQALPHVALGYANSAAIRRDPSYATYLAENYLSRY